jgi:RimJ/RimL family protein N-acetyltransferase
MTPDLNELGQPVGFPVSNWKPPPPPSHEAMSGRYCRLEPLDAARHGEALFAAVAEDRAGAMWTYLPYGPFATAADFRAWLDAECRGADPLYFTVIDVATSAPAGWVSYLRIQPRAGSIEVGHIAYSPQLQRTRAATEAMYLMMRQAFALGYRRYEWKCNALNVPSCRAARRLGFSFEGLFRQAQVVKGRNRDTAWFSVLDSEWPARRAAFERWLDPANFDEQGRQRTRLTIVTRPAA